MVPYFVHSLVGTSLHPLNTRGMQAIYTYFVNFLPFLCDCSFGKLSTPHFPCIFSRVIKQISVLTAIPSQTCPKGLRSILKPRHKQDFIHHSQPFSR